MSAARQKIKDERATEQLLATSSSSSTSTSSTDDNVKTKLADSQPSTAAAAGAFLGRRVAKSFDEITYEGSVTCCGFLDNECLWSVQYDDGDAEEVDGAELQEMLALHENLPESLPQVAVSENCYPTSRTSDDSLDQDKLVKVESTQGRSTRTRALVPRRVTASPGTLIHGVANDDSSDDDDEIGTTRKRNKRARLLYKEESPDQSGHETQDSEEESLPKEAALCHKNRSVRKKDEDKTRDAWLSAGNDAYSSDEDDDDVDEVLHAEEGFHITELRDAAPGRHHKQEFSAPLPESHLALTAEQAQQILQEIEEKPDQALRKLLLDADFQFQLLLHQFFAVRKVAGVPEKFPLHPGSEVQQPATASIQQAIQGLDLDQNKCSTRGVLIADQMGLGKTVEAIAGAILRNALAAAKGEKERPTVIFSPNDAVQVQWRDTLYKNGVPLERIQMFQKGQRSTDFDKAIFLLLTRHRLQSEVKRVFGNLEQAAKHPHMATSVLFSHVTIENLVRLKVQYQDENSKMRVTNSYRKKGRKHERLRHATHQPL